MLLVDHLEGQKAPSAIRCIKTMNFGWFSMMAVTSSESTERHKVH